MKMFGFTPNQPAPVAKPKLMRAGIILSVVAVALSVSKQYWFPEFQQLIASANFSVNTKRLVAQFANWLSWLLLIPGMWLMLGSRKSDRPSGVERK
jgi:hypothetical protein